MFTMVLLLLAVKSIAAFTNGRLSRLIHPKVILNNRRLTTILRSSNDNDVAKKTLSDYIEQTRDQPLEYKHHSNISIEGDGDDRVLKVINKDGVDYRKAFGFIWDPRIYKYTLTVGENPFGENSYGFPGFAVSNQVDVYKDGGRYAHSWYLSLECGRLFSHNGDYKRDYTSKCKAGDIITCIYDATASEISFEKNGEYLGVAFTNVRGEDIAPLVQFTVGTSVTLATISLKQ
jgi:SPRY domain